MIKTTIATSLMLFLVLAGASISQETDGTDPVFEFGKMTNRRGQTFVTNSRIEIKMVMPKAAQDKGVKELVTTLGTTTFRTVMSVKKGQVESYRLSYLGSHMEMRTVRSDGSYKWPVAKNENREPVLAGQSFLIEKQGQKVLIQGARNEEVSPETKATIAECETEMPSFSRFRCQLSRSLEGRKMKVGEQFSLAAAMIPLASALGNKKGAEDFKVNVKFKETTIFNGVQCGVFEIPLDVVETIESKEKKTKPLEVEIEGFCKLLMAVETSRIMSGTMELKMIVHKGKKGQPGYRKDVSEMKVVESNAVARMRTK